MVETRGLGIQFFIFITFNKKMTFSDIHINSMTRGSSVKTIISVKTVIKFNKKFSWFLPPSCFAHHHLRGRCDAAS